MAEVGLKVALYQFYQSAFYLFGFMCLPEGYHFYLQILGESLNADSQG